MILQTSNYSLTTLENYWTGTDVTGYVPLIYRSHICVGKISYFCINIRIDFSYDIFIVQAAFMNLPYFDETINTFKVLYWHFYTYTNILQLFKHEKDGNHIIPSSFQNAIIMDDYDYFEELYSNSVLKNITICFFLIGVVLGLTFEFGIIWYEKNK